MYNKHHYCAASTFVSELFCLRVEYLIHECLFCLFEPINNCLGRVSWEARL
jgi:hypothetical protein